MAGAAQGWAKDAIERALVAPRPGILDGWYERVHAANVGVGVWAYASVVVA